MLGGFVLSTLIVALLFGWVYAYFLLRGDLEAVHNEIAMIASLPSEPQHAAPATVVRRPGEDQRPNDDGV